VKHLETVAGLAHGHEHGDRRENEPDDHDDRTGDDRGQDAGEGVHAAPADNRGGRRVDHAHGGQTAQGGGDAVGFHAKHDRRDEGEGGTEKNRNAKPGKDLIEQGAQAGAKKGHVGIEAGQQRDQHQGAEGHEKHLGAHGNIPQAQPVIRV